MSLGSLFAVTIGSLGLVGGIVEGVTMVALTMVGQRIGDEMGRLAGAAIDNTFHTGHLWQKSLGVAGSFFTSFDVGLYGAKLQFGEHAAIGADALMDHFRGKSPEVAATSLELGTRAGRAELPSESEASEPSPPKVGNGCTTCGGADAQGPRPQAPPPEQKLLPAPPEQKLLPSPARFDAARNVPESSPMEPKLTPTSASTAEGAAVPNESMPIGEPSPEHVPQPGAGCVTCGDAEPPRASQLAAEAASKP